MLWTDGSAYQGEWARGIQHGYGKMVFPDGSVKEGYFDNNVFKVAANERQGKQAGKGGGSPTNDGGSDIMRSTKASS